MVQRIISAVLMIISFGIPVMIILSGIIDGIKGIGASIEQGKKNKEWMKNHNYTTRMMCTSCPYCRYTYYHPFYRGKHRNYMVSKVPKYCRKLGIKLNGDSLCRCVASDASQAMWEEPREDFFYIDQKKSVLEVILVILMAIVFSIFIWKSLPIDTLLKIALFCFTGACFTPLLTISFYDGVEVIFKRKTKYWGLILGSIIYMLLPTILIKFSEHNSYYYAINNRSFISTLLYRSSHIYELVLFVLCLEIVLVLFSIFIAIKGHIISDQLIQEKRKARELEKQREKETRLAQREEFLKDFLGDNYVKLIPIPEEIIFLENGTPVKGKITDSSPFGDLTVYVSKSGRCFHSACGCSGATITQHLYDARRTYSPCSKCCDYQSTSIPEWYIAFKLAQER